MNQDTVVNLATQAMGLALKVAGPLLLAALVVGVIVSVFQAVTQIQEQSLSLMPKIVAVAVVIVVLGPWMLGQLVTYTAAALQLDPDDGGHVTHLLSQLEGNQLGGFILVLARVTPLFLLAPIFSSSVIPPRRQGRDRRRDLGRADADRDARPAHPQRSGPDRGPGPRGPAGRHQLRVRARRADGGRRIGRVVHRRRLGLLLRGADQPDLRPDRRRDVALLRALRDDDLPRHRRRRLDAAGARAHLRAGPADRGAEAGLAR